MVGRRHGPFHVGERCSEDGDGFDVLAEGEVTDEFTIFVDSASEITRVVYRAQYPEETLTNTVTGKTIVDRGHFTTFFEPISGTGEFTYTTVGASYLVNEPGEGLTIRNVGRITYADLAHTIVLWQAGKHDLAPAAELQQTFCDALA
jgi:hypothetical protein